MPEKYPSGKWIRLATVAVIVGLVALCSREDPTPLRPEKYAEVDCSGKSELQCFEAKQLDKRRRALAEKLDEEGFFDE